MDDENFDELMKNPDFVHGYAMAMVHSSQQLRFFLDKTENRSFKERELVLEGWIEGCDSWEDWESRVIRSRCPGFPHSGHASSDWTCPYDSHSSL